MSKQIKFFPEVRERSRTPAPRAAQRASALWAAVESIAPMLGCTSQTLLGWVKQEQAESGERDG